MYQKYHKCYRVHLVSTSAIHMQLSNMKHGACGKQLFHPLECKIPTFFIQKNFHVNVKNYMLRGSTTSNYSLFRHF